MQTYGQYSLVAEATELVAERWTPLILRKPLTGSHPFNQLERGLPGSPRSLLVQRLRRLKRAGILERRMLPNGRACSYELTVADAALLR